MYSIISKKKSNSWDLNNRSEIKLKQKQVSRLIIYTPINPPQMWRVMLTIYSTQYKNFIRFQFSSSFAFHTNCYSPIEFNGKKRMEKKLSWGGKQKANK